jgi:hypothetical protein
MRVVGHHAAADTDDLRVVIAADDRLEDGIGRGAEHDGADPADEQDGRAEDGDVLSVEPPQVHGRGCIVFCRRRRRQQGRLLGVLDRGAMVDERIGLIVVGVFPHCAGFLLHELWERSFGRGHKKGISQRKTIRRRKPGFK